MFGAATQRLAAWLAGTCPEAAVSLDAPGEEPSNPTLHVWLTEIRPGEMRSDRRSALVEALLRYVVAVDGAPAEEAHDLLGTVFAAAAADPGMRIVGDPVRPEAWIAHGTVPRPCLVVEVAVRAERTIEHRWTVEHPLEVHVVGREEVPAAAASGSAGAVAPPAPGNGQSNSARG